MNILVIGNGFDLAHDLPTSYSDVLNFLQAINITSKWRGEKNEFINTHLSNKNFNSYVSDYIINAFDSRTKKGNSAFKNSNPIIQELYDNLDNNIWYTYLWDIYSMGKMKGINWIDFEGEISHIIERIDKEEENIYLPFRKITSEKDEKIAYPKMALAASLLYFASEDIDSEELLKWMRFSRNIVNNTRIDSENIHNVLSAFKKWAKQLKRKGWGKFIEELQYHSSISKSQIDEEKAKSDWLNHHPECAHYLHTLENHRFFLGRISFLITFIKGQKIDNPTEESSIFNGFAKLLFNLFDNDGPNRNLNGSDLRLGHRFHRAVLTLSEYHGYGVWHGANWVLSNSKEDWKQYLEDFNCDNDGNPHNIGFTRLISKLNGHEENEYSEIIKKIIYTNKESVSDWRHNLICYHDLWDYMDSKNIRFDGNNKVFLIKGVALGRRNRRSELRARGLYSFLKKEVFKNKDEQGVILPLNGWTLNFWDWYGSDRKNSCLFLQKNLNEKVIAIDVFFDTTQDINDAYCIEIFDRKGQKEQSREISELSLQQFENLLKKNDFVWNDYYVERRNLSRMETINFLKEFIQY